MYLYELWTQTELEAEQAKLEAEVKRLENRATHMRLVSNPPRLHNLLIERVKAEAKDSRERLQRVKNVLAHRG